MKSPWKYLTGLLSRGRHAHFSVTTPSTDEGDIDSNEAEAALNSQPAEPPNVIVPGEGAHEEAPDDAKPRDASVTANVSQWPATEKSGSSYAGPASLTPEKTRPERSFPTLGVKSSRGKRAHDSVHNAQATLGQKDQSLAAPTQPLKDQVVALDAEIALLRTQLAEKLYLQNLQLKLMLERFD